MFDQSGLQIQPLEVNDFSGGMTDYYLQGDTKRYQRANNFWINVDKMLEVRWGSVGFDTSGNHKLARKARVDAFLLFDQGQELLTVQARDVLYLNSTPAWTSLTGPSGNEALSAGEPYDAISSSLWNGHLFVASEGFGRPSRIYKDQNSAYQVRTVGLPRPQSTPVFSDTNLLASCLDLANGIRTSMISHMRDAAGLDPFNGQNNLGFLHSLPDKYSLSYIDSVQTFLATGAPTFSGIDLYYPGPTPVPTPAPAATDATTLYTLVQALSYAYNQHGYDPANGAFSYHSFGFYDSTQLISSSSLGPYEKVAVTLPETLDEAAARLNELRRKWYWHQFTPWTHHYTNNYAIMNRYRVTAPAIPTIDTDGVLSVTANYTDYLRYVNYLKNAYNVHTTNGRVGADFWTSLAGAVDEANTYHTGAVGPSDLTFPIWVTLPDATDLDSAALIIAWVGLLYGTLHYPDANIATHTNFWADTTASSSSLTDVRSAASGGGTTITIPTSPKTQTIIGSAGVFTASGDTDRSYWGGRATATGLGTATISRTAASTVNDTPMQYSSSYLHGSWTQGSAAYSPTLATRTTTPALAGEAISDATLDGLSIKKSNLPQTTAAWIEVAEEIFEALNTHAGNGVSHKNPFNIGGYFQGNTTPNAYPTITQKATLLFYTGQGPFYKPEIASYVYGATFKTIYTTEQGVDFTNISEPVFTGLVETGKLYPVGSTRPSGITGIPDGKVEVVYGATVTNLPVLANTSKTNYDTAGALVQIYRTIDSGNTYYLLDELANGATSLTDTIPDTESGGGIDALDTREELYTTGGVVENVQPPECKYLHVVGDKAYYGYILDDGQIFKNRVIQSIPGYLDGAPLDFSDDVDDELTGISSTRSKVIVFCYNQIYRLEGGVDERGQGFLTHERISDKVGCVSAASIVQTEIGVFFAGNDGFYYTDSYQIIKVSIDLNISYALRTQTREQQRRIYGTYDRLTRKVFWTTQSQPTDTDCDEIFCYYLDYGVKPSGAFTTMSNGVDFRPSAIAMFNGDIIRGDERGLIFRHNEVYLSDPKVPDDLTTALSSWATVHIPYDYSSCALDFGTIYKGQYVTKIHFLGANEGNFNMQAWVVADNRFSSDEGQKPLAPIRYTDNPMWGDPLINWDDDLTWKYDGKPDFWRRFPGSGLRSQVKQIRFLPAREGVYKYDDYPEGSYSVVDSLLGTATLTQPTGYTALAFPTDVVGMFIAFDDDDYTAEWEILTVAGGVLTLDDSDVALTDLAAAKWVIRGYMKQAKLAPTAYAIHFAQLGERGRPYAGDRGENA